jgi:hypothetical protein
MFIMPALPMVTVGSYGMPTINGGLYIRGNQDRDIPEPFIRVHILNPL